MSDANAAARNGARLSKIVLGLSFTLARGILQILTALVNLMEKHGTEK